MKWIERQVYNWNTDEAMDSTNNQSFEVLYNLVETQKGIDKNRKVRVCVWAFDQ